MSKKITAVVLMNLGGPSKRQEVRKFLFNLFSDKNIIRLPWIFRKLIAFMISSLRYKKATHEYNKMGGASPILANTIAQQKALQERLGNNYEVMIVMRYSKPGSREVIEKIAAAPNKYKDIILLPLYPQYSTTTTYSSFQEFYKLARGINSSSIAQLVIPVKAGIPDDISIKTIEHYYDHPDFIEYWTDAIKQELKQIKDKNYIILFSAHGIPEEFVEQGDPYQLQIEASVKAICSNLTEENYIICYQSRVGPKKWLTPYTDETLKKQKGRHVLIVPIAFTSEHLETLVELGMQYNELAKEVGVKSYKVIPTPGTHPKFIDCLENLTKRF